MDIIDLQCLQTLSLMKWIFIQISITHDKISTYICKYANHTKLCFNISHLDELKVSWDDNIYKLIHKKCH